MAHHVFTREQHPLVFVITHWLNLLAMVFLTLSGFYIHFPYFQGGMGVARGIHFFWMFVLLINLLVRLVLTFVVKTSRNADGTEVGTDVWNFIPQPENRGSLFGTVGYYLFFVKEKPGKGKYNPLQKVAYVATVPLTLFAAYTGFALWGPTSDWALFAAGTDYFSNLFHAGGGADPMPIRIVHFWTMWVILMFTFIHVYLAYIGGTAAGKIMFTWKETRD